MVNRGAGSSRKPKTRTATRPAFREEENSLEPSAELRGVEWRDRPEPWVTPTFQCSRCHLWFVLEAFPPNARAKSGRSSWCRECQVERTRQWRADNPEYVQAYNAGRRAGPFPATCPDCGEPFEASRRMQKRCPDCQAVHVRRRKR